MFERAEKGLYIKCSKEEKKKAGDPGKGAQATGALPEKSIKKYTGGSRADTGAKFLKTERPVQASGRP